VASALSALGAAVENSSGLVQASGTGSFSNADVLTKTRRDALARAFSDVSQTSTWILFADVISQAGKFANNAFQVESEQRKWQTFSIQRNSAKIIDQHNEKVFE
jgi:hypothetical protein